MWRAGSKDQFFKGKYDARIEFPVGMMGSTFCGRGMEIFWNNTILD